MLAGVLAVLSGRLPHADAVVGVLVTFSATTIGAASRYRVGLQDMTATESH
ncbi:hypothetical protein [Umezawaea sp. Da 62-37]|uniref:hypothetical protein n=1 Tax=Umezawaea sp. Da 62-37 TaxID=3075927 RepID=UPI0028F71B01|nr:hypothetical protein [Umezawaea sp. Da 62-37]WNV87259.1 hypothetical protein RM788_02880 [Umezawaea sp. Da 62-37]